MEIGPTKPGGFKVNEPAHQRSHEKDVDESNHRLDASIRSADSQGVCPADVPAGGLECCGGSNPDQESPPDLDRLLQIRDRIEAGYYDQIWVKEKMIDRMVDEMLRNISEFYK